MWRTRLEPSTPLPWWLEKGFAWYQCGRTHGRARVCRRLRGAKSARVVPVRSQSTRAQALHALTFTSTSSQQLLSLMTWSLEETRRFLRSSMPQTLEGFEGQATDQLKTFDVRTVLRFFRQDTRCYML